ncbi:hypothetical protein KR200_007850 [Drosophila serrata]|nr:hypothetical protein KR200_007850 [Drosophila serrata]
MATMVRQFTRSAIREVRQPRWNQLLLESYKNLHLKAIHHQRRFSFNPDDGNEDQEEGKFCIDYKKNPTIEGHEPPPLPDLQPKSPKLRITKRRKFLKEKKCKDLVKELGMENEEDNNPCAKFSKVCFLWGRPKILLSWHSSLMQLSNLRSLDPDPVYLNPERTFSRKADQEQGSLTVRSAPSKPVPPKSERMARKRKHFQAKQKKEAEAKAIANLKHPTHISNTQIKEDLNIVQSNKKLTEKMVEGTSLDIAQPRDAASIEKAELKQLLKIINERCRRKCAEFEKARKAASKKEAEEAAQRNQTKMTQIRKLCQEAKKFHSFKIDKQQKQSVEAQLRKHSEAKLRNQSKKAKPKKPI